MDGLANIAVGGGDTRITFPRPGAMTPAQTRSPKGDGAHLTTLGVVYANDIGGPGFRRQPFAFPVGSIIVRERLLTESGNPDLLVVMVKREKNFNRKANDWEFLTVSGDLTKLVKREKEGKCLACHVQAAQTDFVFPENARARLGI